MTVAAAAAPEATVAGGDCPFPGLDPFREDDGAFFFGRTDDRRIIAANLKASRLTVLYGASGVGKSSVLLAGVVGDLRRQALANAQAQRLDPDEPAPFAVAAFRSWADPPLPLLVERIRYAAMEALGGEQLEPWQPDRPLRDTLREWTERVHYLYVVLDQFEEYFVYHQPSRDESSFDVQLARILNCPDLRVHVLLSLREDALALLDRFKGAIPELYATTLRVDHLDLDAAREAIVRPLEAWRTLRGEDVTVEDALVEALLASPDLRARRQVRTEGGAALVEDDATPRIETPYLQLVLRRLWYDDRAGGELRKQTLDDRGGPRAIVQQHLQTAMDALAPDAQEVAADAFRFLVTPSKTKIAHTAADLADFMQRPVGEVTPVLDALCSGTRILRRLMPPPDPADPAAVLAPRYEIFHDVLADAVLAWRTQKLAARAAREEREESERRVREAEERARRDHRRALVSYGLAAVAAAACIATGVLAWQAIDAQDRAQHAQKKAALDSAIAEAQASLPVNPVVALAAALSGLHVDPESLDAQRLLREAVPASRLRAVFPQRRGFVTSAAFGRDGVMALGTATGNVSVWYWPGRRELFWIHYDRRLGGIRAVRFADRGRYLVVQSGPTADLWDIRACRKQHRCAPLHVPDREAGFSAVAAADAGRAVALATSYELLVGDGVHERSLVRGTFDTVALSADGSTLAAGTARGRILVWRRRHGTFRRVAALVPGWTQTAAVAVSPRGAYLAAAGGRVGRVWDLTTCGRSTCRLVRTLRSPAAIDSLTFDRSGTRIGVAAEDGVGRIWDRGSASPLVTLLGHRAALSDIEFDPVGRYVVTASADGTARVWSVATGLVFRGNRGAANSATFAAGGRYVVTAGSDGTARVFGRDGREQAVLLVTAGISALSPSERDHMTAAVHRRLSKIAPVGGPATSAAAAPNGPDLVTADGSGRLFRWDLSQCLRVFVCLPTRRLASSDVYEAQDVVVRRGLAAAVYPGRGIVLVPLGGGEARAVFEIGSASAVAIDRQGKLLAAGSTDGTTRLYDISRCAASYCGGQLRPLRVLHQPGGVYAVAFSSDGRQIATGGSDRIVRVWDLGVRGSQPLMFVGHTGVVRTISFSRAGDRLVSGGSDATTRVWNTSNGRILAVLQMHAEPINTAQFDPARPARILTASDDGTARIYSCSICGNLDALERTAVTLEDSVKRPLEWLAADRPSAARSAP